MPAPSPTSEPTRLSGIDVMRGVGLTPAKPFWADAWGRVIRRKGAIVGFSWISIVAFFAITAPFIASGHPIVFETLNEAGEVVRTSFPLIDNLGPADVLLTALPFIVLAWWLLPQARRPGVPILAAMVFAAMAVAVYALRISQGGWTADTPSQKLLLAALATASMASLGAAMPRSQRLVGLLIASAQIAITLVIVGVLINRLTQRDLSEFMLELKRRKTLAFDASAVIACGVALLFVAAPVVKWGARRFAMVVSVAVLAATIGAMTWLRPLETYRYLDQETAGEARAVYTLIPFSPNQRFSELNRIEPGSNLGESLGHEKDSPAWDRSFVLGTDAFGSDVLSQMMHACRLSISIGFVSTGISLLIGITLGALMGYFGGWVDLILFRIVEIFMAVPVLILMIVAVAVLPEELRSTYVMMGIIGCFSWTGAARFTRAEFLKLRSQDFVQAAKAVGLPLPSILFKHMLPNGVTPVLVDASFAIAAAILAEATLSYLGLGPVDQPSWGKLLASAASSEAVFKWWLAIFPGAAIFLTVLSYNMIGEAMRDAIDPKLRKAAH